MFIVAKRSPISATAEHLSLVGPSAYNYLPVELLVYPRRPTARFVVVLKHFYSPSFILDHCIFLSYFIVRRLRMSDGGTIPYGK